MYFLTETSLVVLSVSIDWLDLTFLIPFRLSSGIYGTIRDYDFIIFSFCSVSSSFEHPFLTLFIFLKRSLC